jgi:D-3-phosphoglycerate dehydrogenase
VTKEILEAATNLKVSAAPASAWTMSIFRPPRQGRGGDEHAVRQLDHHRRTRHRDDVRARPPDARGRRQTQAGKWPKNRFMGVEVTGKTLGLIGAGNIGSIVASRALGLKMKVVAFDPFLTPERAVEMGVEKADLDTLLARPTSSRCTRR